MSVERSTFVKDSGRPIAAAHKESGDAMGPLDIIDAIRLANRNKEKYEELNGRIKKLKKDAHKVEGDYAALLEKRFNKDLGPFAIAFARIKNCDLEQVDVTDRVPSLGEVNPKTRKMSLDAVQGLTTLAGGAAAGAAGGALTFAAVGAFATASTGTAIGTLSGAAATSATLAWLGGGSLAAGGLGMAGGTLVLAGIVAVPVILAAGGFMWWKGSKELAKQKQARAELRAAEAQIDRDEALLKAVTKQVKRASETLNGVGRQMRILTTWLVDRLSTNDDYRTFTEEERQKLAVLVSLATAMSAIMVTPLVGTDKHRATIVNPDFAPTVKSVIHLLDSVTGHEHEA